MWKNEWQSNQLLKGKVVDTHREPKSKSRGIDKGAGEKISKNDYSSRV